MDDADRTALGCMFLAVLPLMVVALACVFIGECNGRHAQCRDLGGIATADDKCVFVDGGK